MELFGYTLNSDRLLSYELTKVKGIGISSSRMLLSMMGFDPRYFYVRQITQDQIDELRRLIDNSELKIGRELDNFVQDNVKRLVDAKSYKGIRHLRHMPVRGQRTHTNAKTAKRLNGK